MNEQAPAGWILAIEMSNPGANPGTHQRSEVLGPSVAVARMTASPEYSKDHAIESVRTGSRDVDDLVPAIARVCNKAGIVAHDIGCVAVSVGPGGYTSVRMSVAAAATIAHATGARAVPVPTALAVGVYGIAEEKRPLLICLASKGDTTHMTHIDVRGRCTDLGVLDAGVLDTALDRRPVRTLVGDQHVPAPFVSWANTRGIERLSPVFSANNVLRAGLGLPSIGPEALRTIYPREPDAVTQWRARQHGR